jgi:hypothetical protein
MNHGKKSQVTPPGIDPGSVRLVAQRFNHYATPHQWKKGRNVVQKSKIFGGFFTA